MYRSEGAMQVGFLKLKFLMKVCKNVDPSEWNTYFLCYDQGCRIAESALFEYLICSSPVFSVQQALFHIYNVFFGIRHWKTIFLGL